ncbi:MULTISPECIES: hypothetical protein [Glutamicibacter]|uniref:hypothetical protein n=1 Tax=Glutamicibacter TaxID=1742989 RepID=UPI003FD208C6
MRNKTYKAMSIMAVAGLLLTSCTSNDAPNNGENPQTEEKVDLSGFPELTPDQESTKFHQTFAYNAPNGTARRASMTIQEFPNGGYIIEKVRKGFVERLAEENNGKPASKSAVEKKTQEFLKEQADKNDYFTSEFRVDKIKDGQDEDEAFEAKNEIYVLVNQACTQSTSTSTIDPLFNIPYGNGCLVSKSPGSIRDSSFRETASEWESEISPFNYGDSSIKTDYVTVAGGGMEFPISDTSDPAEYAFEQVFAVYDREGGGEPIASLPNFTCEPGSAGQAILDAFKTESDARGGVAKRYMMFAPEGSGCTMQPVPSASENS